MNDNIKKLTKVVIPGINEEISEIKQSQDDLTRVIGVEHDDIKRSIGILEERVKILENDISVQGWLSSPLWTLEHWRMLI